MSATDLYEDWGRRVREAREELGLTQRDLAEKTGISQQMISALERGMFGAGDGTKRALAASLQRRPADLFPYPEDLEPAAAVAP